MSVAYRIPKFSDKEIALRLNRVLLALVSEKRHTFKLLAHITHHGAVELPQETPLEAAQAKFAFDSNSQVIPNFSLVSQNGHQAFRVLRKPAEATDFAEITDDWTNNPDPNLRARLPELHVALLSLTRRELNAPELEASLTGSGDDAWSRYRDAQTAVINSLQQATETLIIKATEKNAELDAARAKRYAEFEADLRSQIENERKALQNEYDKKQGTIAHREKVLSDREASFNTKEARYVARKKQEEQIDQVKNWLSDWRLTSGTTAKRRPIFWAYVVALILTGGLTAYATYHNYQLLKSADDIAKLTWWNWVAITTKSFFPLAAFTTFMIYFIRWSSSWARQHADEEFRNRTRLIDIGRSGWLLEAVRDAQENKNEIPVDLLKELSRNLFSNAGPAEGDIHPQAVSDILLQGLSSVRVKSADGSEVEATRSGKKK